MPITSTLKSHDLLLTDYASPAVTIGLTIEKDEKGIPIFHRYPAESLVPQQVSQLTDALFPIHRIYPMTQEAWHAGFGQQQGKADGQKRYMYSVNTDASVKGLIYASPAVVATTNTTPSYASTATITNGDFETGALSPWTSSGIWVIASSGTPHGGTYHAQFSATGDSVSYTLTQSITAADSSLFNTLQIDIEVWSKYVTAAPATAKVELQDNNNKVVATANLSNTTSYVKTTLSHTFTDGWPSLKIVITINDGGDGTALFYVDDIVLTLTGTIATATNVGTIAGMVEFNGNHYAYSDTGLWKRTAANWVRVAGSPDNIVHAAGDSGGTQLLLARGSSLNYWYMSTAEAFSRNTGTGTSAQVQKFIASAGSDYSAVDTTSVFKVASISLGTANTTYPALGDTGLNITRLIDHLGSVYGIKENYAAKLVSGAWVEIGSELRSMFNTNTGKNAISWRGNGAQALYIPAGSGSSLMAYDDGDFPNIGPDMFAELLSDFTGQIVATASDDQWLYIILDNGSNIEILKGRYETIDGATDFRWHSYVQTAYTTVAYAYVSSITAKRLYFGGGTDLPKYIPLPTAFGDPINDSNLTYATGAIHYGSWLDLNQPRISKSYLNFTMDSVALAAAKNIKVEYELWESQGTWTELGGSGNGVFTSSPNESKTFAVNIKGRKLRFRYTWTSDDTSVGFGIKGVTVYVSAAPPRLNAFYTRVRVKDDIILKGGDKDLQMTYGIVALQLHTWKDTQPLLLTYPDGLLDAADGSHDGSTIEVKFEEGYPKEHSVNMDDDLHESVFELVMVEILRSIS
ncbi:hypothetical protein LCGC14_0637640 [marine sediment metagenome]|uniref:Uncharacterized protein n=1 Tax=marine sediment metagenome TaxID=412755 RepID=A0A0F9U8J8_9ZZZZ